MSAKLIVHKYETGVDNIKYLQITIEDGDNDTSQIKFSEWIDGKPHHEKNDNEKSSRLVVKIVSGNEMNNFDLDSCASVIDSLRTELNNSTRSVSNLNYGSINNHNDTQKYSNTFENLERNICHMDYYDQFKNKNINTAMENTSVDNSHKNMCSVENETIYTDANVSDLSPLEYSLEKVKENNARIMENIHMLNRTLNYTKKREILDIICPKSMRSFPCNTCGKCFVYETGLRKHYSMRHATAEVQPRWQIVWTCIECFQVWPRQELAIRHSIQCSKGDNTDCVIEIKTSLLLQCEFCEKVFTSIPRLLRHSKMHTTTYNYECNACAITYSSYKRAEEHWLSCPWLKSCYTFSLSKMLLCNACDRKFRNYDLLYNHRYKAGHFMTKTHSDGHIGWNNQNMDLSLAILLYQCENCGQCFSTVQFLQAHRNLHHPRYENGSHGQIDIN